ncbi:MAG TPA: HIT domain-containing protein [Methylomirabilota bacterium]|nr:HIT domain-containing protein [Methylomirabilota bacterium]
MKRLWAPWRMAYVGGSTPTTGCIFCNALTADDDPRHLVLVRRPAAFLILNAYPYTPGHLMAALNRHVGTVGEATAEELAQAMQLVAVATSALVTEYRAEGFNIGLNQGRVAGAGITDHLHVHVVPRWQGDSNFMPVLGDVRVLPEALDATWQRLRSRLRD